MNAQASPPVKTDPDRLSVGRLTLLAGLAALGALATNIMLPAFPEMALALHVLPRDLALTLSSFFIVFAIGQLLVGPLSDGYGRAPFVIGGLGVFILGSLICLAAPSLPVLIIGRIVQALGACSASVIARAIARDLYSGPALTRALALVMIAMAAAPGFSPFLGTALTASFGWRSTFAAVALAGLLFGFHYHRSAGETLPPERRQPVRLMPILSSYGRLATDRRFIAPAMSVSLIIGCLYTFFGAAPSILMAGMGMSSAGLSAFFAATVFVVFGGGMIAPRFAARWGAPRVGMAGLAIALAGSLWLVVRIEAPNQAEFTAAITIFLLGMGIVNPIGSAIALEPFGDRAGIASALLGFLQMGCAAIGTALISIMPLDPVAAYVFITMGGTSLAALCFLPALKPPQIVGEEFGHA